MRFFVTPPSSFPPPLCIFSSAWHQQKTFRAQSVAFQRGNASLLQLATPAVAAAIVAFTYNLLLLVRFGFVPLVCRVKYLHNKPRSRRETGNSTMARALTIIFFCGRGNSDPGHGHIVKVSAAAIVNQQLVNKKLH